MAKRSEREYGKSIALPEGMSFTHDGDRFGLSLGDLTVDHHFPPRVNASVGPEGVVLSSRDKMMLHTAHAIVRNFVRGMTEPYTKEVELVGLGYSVVRNEEGLLFNLSYSHPVLFRLPAGVVCKTVGSRKLRFASHDKDILGRTVRGVVDIKRPNPYFRNGIYEVGRVYLTKKSNKG